MKRNIFMKIILMATLCFPLFLSYSFAFLDPGVRYNSSRTQENLGTSINNVFIANYTHLNIRNIFQNFAGSPNNSSYSSSLSDLLDVFDTNNIPYIYYTNSVDYFLVYGDVGSNYVYVDNFSNLGVYSNSPLYGYSLTKTVFQRYPTTSSYPVNIMYYAVYDSSTTYSIIRCNTIILTVQSYSSNSYIKWDGVSYLYEPTPSGPSYSLSNDDLYSIVSYINTSDEVKNNISAVNHTDFFIVYKFHNDTFDDDTYDVYFYDKDTILGQYVTNWIDGDNEFTSYRIGRRDVSTLKEFFGNYITGVNWNVAFDHFVLSYSKENKNVTDFYFSSYKKANTMPLFNYDTEPIVYTTKYIQYYSSYPDTLDDSIMHNSYDDSKNIPSTVITNPSDSSQVLSPSISPSTTQSTSISMGNVFANIFGYDSSVSNFFNIDSGSVISSYNSNIINFSEMTWLFNGVSLLFSYFSSFIILCLVLVLIGHVVGG